MLEEPINSLSRRSKGKCYLFTNLCQFLLWRRQSKSLSKGCFLLVSVPYWLKSSLKILYFAHNKTEFIAKETPVPCKTNRIYCNVPITKCISHYQTKRYVLGYRLSSNCGMKKSWSWNKYKVIPFLEGTHGASMYSFP